MGTGIGREAVGTPHLLAQLPARGLFVGLPDGDRTADRDLVAPGKPGHVPRALMNEDPSVPVAAHRDGDTVQPPMPNSLVTAHHTQHPVPLVDSLDQLIHEPTITGATDIGRP
ncbi:hypothetical protein SAMN02745830_05295 [Streptomyces sp. Amel2xC10]|nr:hypothetical protein SAMN02745830_05295 [Streptomyces sp. Amel2xC10]